MHACNNGPDSAAIVGVDAPRVWLVLGDKQGDNGQVEVIEKALPWACERKNIQMLKTYAVRKPRVKASLYHIDKDRSDPLEPPWPDLIITIGRRPANVALWIRKQSEGHTKIVLVGKPSGMVRHFDLVIHSAEAQFPPLPKMLSLGLPLMQVRAAAVRAEAETWQPRLADLPRPLIGILVGGPTNPFRYNEAVSDRLIELATDIIADKGGTPYITSSRRTPLPTVESLKARLPAGARLSHWKPDLAENPYRALLGLADGFIVTGDSISMMVEVIRMRKPLAILGLPRSWLGSVDQLRRSLTRWLFAPGADQTRKSLRERLAVILYRLHLVSHTRDFLAFHKTLIDGGLAVRAGEDFRPPQGQLADDLPRVVDRIKGLVDVR